MPSHQLKTMGSIHCKAYSTCDLVVRWEDLVPATFPIVYTTILKGISNMNLIRSLPNWGSVPSAQYWLVISSKVVSPHRSPNRDTRLPLIDNPVRKYISSISMGKIWISTTKCCWSGSHIPMIYSRNQMCAFMSSTWNYFRSPQFRRASMVVGSLAAWFSGTSCSLSFQITMRNL